MCRILFLKWKNTKKALEYVNAFYEAWFNDPHLKTWLNKQDNKNSHIHGWGYLLVTEDNIINYLNANAFFEDKKWFSDLKEKIKNISWEFLLMAEFRLTDSGYVSALNSHPFNFSSRNWYEWVFFYNWIFDHQKLANIENINYNYFSKKNSTTILGHSFSRILEETDDIYKAIDYPKIALKTWYNLMMFVNDNLWNYKAIVHSYANKELLDKDNNYKTYISLIKKIDSDLSFVWSNAISCFRKDSYEYMKNSESIEFNIDFIKEFYIENSCDFIL